MTAGDSISQSAKKLVHAGLRRLGYRLIAAKQMVPATAGWDVRGHWIGHLGVDLVIDVGANTGQFAQEVRRGGYAGRIVSFEPLRAAFAVLSEASSRDDAWEVVNCALAEADSMMELYVAGNSVSSSLLPMLNSHVDALPVSATVATETVRLARLDAELSPLLTGEERFYLKADTQGYELEVLKGAGAVLQQVVAMELEMSLVPLYEGQPLLPQMVTAVEAMGFTPVWIDQGFSDPSVGRLLQVDGLFVRSGLLERHRE